MASEYDAITPYHFALNNPISANDPTGLWVSEKPAPVKLNSREPGSSSEPSAGLAGDSNPKKPTPVEPIDPLRQAVAAANIERPANNDMQNNSEVGIIQTKSHNTNDKNGNNKNAGEDPPYLILKSRKTGEVLKKVPFKNKKAKTTTIYIEDDNDMPDVIGWGWESSYTLGGGVHFGGESVTFLVGPNTGETHSYRKMGVNIGLEGSMGIYFFVAEHTSKDKSKVNTDSWKGWFNGYSVGIFNVGGGYFWSNKEDKPSMGKDKQSIYNGGQSSLPYSPSMLKLGAKWSASYYWYLGKEY